jgi:hypothetical protein
MPNFSFLSALRFALCECEKFELPVGYDQKSDEMLGDEEGHNGLYGGNSNAGGCVSDVLPGDEVET